MLPAKLLTDYTNQFFGFGRWEANIWFVGIEEAGGWTEEDVQNRLAVWQQNGKRDLEDAPTFYPATGNVRWHGEAAVLQETWEQLVRMLLVARGLADVDEAILDYQRHQLGRIGGETCLNELLPLPSPRIKDWRYQNWSDLHWLASRERYYAHILVARAGQLGRRIQALKPSVVIFYGASFFRTWSCIANAKWSHAIPEKLVTFSNGTTTFFVTKHPVDPALGDGRRAYFREIGNYFRLNHAGLFAACGVRSEVGAALNVERVASRLPSLTDWHSAIGNFIVNYGVLDWHLLVFLEKRLPPNQFARIKALHFQDRMARTKALVTAESSLAQQQAFASFSSRLDPIRELRNHIAHGHMLVRVLEDGKSLVLTLSQPKDLDANYEPATRHLEFEELIRAQKELAALIEEFPKLDGGWKRETWDSSETLR